MRHLDDLLSAYLDGALSAAEAERAGAHLAECDLCRAELEDVREARQAVRALPMLEAPIPLLAVARRRPWLKAAASVAAGLLVVGLAVAPGESSSVDLDRLSDRHAARVVVDGGISTLRGAGGAP